MKILNKNLFKQPFFWTSICSCLALGILIALYSHAWVAPGAAPNLNTNAAINFYNGYVGIGTATPNGPLVVNSAADQGRIRISGASDSGYTYTGLYLDDNSADNNNSWVLTHKNDQGQSTQDDFQIVRWITASPASNRVDLAIDSVLGNVGIGTTAPDAALTVKTSGSNAALNMYGVIASTDYSVLQVSTTGGLTNPSSRALNIQPNGGNVGIGPCENLPSEKLEVMGNIKISGTGNGIKFPDGTVQTTAASGGGTIIAIPSGTTGTYSLNWNAFQICQFGTCCPPWKDCDSDTQTYQLATDCDEGCATCYVGSTQYTAAPDGKDQDCDGVVDEFSGTCTPTYGSSTTWGYDGSSCNWVSGGSYHHVQDSGNAKTDTTHCIASGTTCTSYSGGFGNCTVVVGNLPSSTSVCQGVTCGSKCWLTSTQSGVYTNAAWIQNCTPMTGCTATPKYN